MIRYFNLSIDDINSLLSISKVLKCDRIIYDATQPYSILGVGPDNSYIQRIIGLQVELPEYCNGIMFNVLEMKNLAKLNSSASITCESMDVDYIRNANSRFLSLETDSNLIGNVENYNEHHDYQTLQSAPASLGAMCLYINNVGLWIPKTALPTTKSDKVNVNLYTDGTTKVIRMNIYKPKNIIIQQSFMYL